MSDKLKSLHIKTLLLTLFALVAFAANSVLCRLALGAQSIDAASFTIIRLFSGIVALLMLFRISNRKEKPASSGSWQATFMLFIYAASFSFAYLTLETGTGALILFAAVQITIILSALFKGDRLSWPEWVGVFIAFSGFVYLVLPGVSSPSLTGFILMTIAGMAWGFYTIMGRDSKNPLADTARNFTRTWPLLLILALFASQFVHLSAKGVILAILSGALASGMGYAVWYMALGGLSSAQSAVVQLLVPVFAAAGGVLFISELVSLRLMISAVMIGAGVLLVLYFPRSLKTADVID